MNTTKKINIKALREKYGMSQEDLSRRLGISRPTLVKIERNERNLRLEEMQKIVDIFSVANDFQNNNLNNIRISIPQKKIEKFEQVLLYILEKVGGKANVGMTVLYKLLYFIDFDYYEKYEEQLMGLTYFKNTHGPAPREFVKVVEKMKKEGKLEEVKSKHFTYEQKKFLPLTGADLKIITGQELEMIDDVLARYSDKNASELSNISHEDMPWAAAKSGENLEYDHVFYRPDSISVREYEKL